MREIEKFGNRMKEIVRRNSLLVSNFSYLSFLQIATLLIPLVTYPHLIRVLGSELYGLVIFTQVIVGYFTIFVSFGFTTTGIQEVSVNRDNKEKLSEIVSTITFTKVVFMLICFICLLGYFTFSQIEHKWLYILAFWVCLLDVIFPTWFFQGIEKMKYITLISLSTRLLFLIFVFIFIRSKEHVLWLPISNIIVTLLSGWGAFYFIKKEGVYFIFPSVLKIKEYIKKSYYFFITNFLTQIYANSSRAIIGSFLGMSAVAHYDLAEKVVNLIRMPQGILAQTVFPRINLEKNISFIKKVFKISILLNVVLYVFLFLGAEYIVILLGGEKMLPAVPIIKILGTLAPIVAVSNVAGVLVLIPFGFDKLFVQVIGTSVIGYLVMFSMLWMLNAISIYSLSIVNVLVEVLVSVVSVYFVYKNNILWRRNTITSL